MFENRADLDRELLATLTALFQAVADNAVRVLLAGLGADTGQIVHATADNTAMRASNPIDPHDAFQIRESLGFVMEMRGRKNRHGECSVDASLIASTNGFVNYTIAKKMAIV